jgi:hypothetical protein
LADAPDDEWPDQVELLFDGKRPQVSEVDPMAGRLKVRHQENGHVAEIKEVKKMSRTPVQSEYRCKE